MDAIHDHGWSEQDNFFPPDLTLALALECAALATAGTLTLALVGQGAARSLQPDVRGDRIQWLEAGQSVVLKPSTSDSSLLSPEEK